MRWIEPSLQGKFKGISVLFWGQRVSKYVDVTRCPIKAPFSKFFYVSSSHPNDALCSSFSSKITGSAEDLIVFRAQVELLRLLQGPRTQIAKNIGSVFFFSFHCLNTISQCHGPRTPTQLLVHPEMWGCTPRTLSSVLQQIVSQSRQGCQEQAILCIMYYVFENLWCDRQACCKRSLLSPSF